MESGRGAPFDLSWFFLFCRSPHRLRPPLPHSLQARRVCPRCACDNGSSCLYHQREVRCQEDISARVRVATFSCSDARLPTSRQDSITQFDSNKSLFVHSSLLERSPPGHMPPLTVGFFCCHSHEVCCQGALMFQHLTDDL